LLAATFAHASGEPHWIRLDSSHYSVLTDADEKKGHEVLVRFEQMRAVFGQLLMRSRLNLSEPIDIIALKSADEFSAVAPNGVGTGGSFMLPGEDRDFFVLDPSQDQSWRAVSPGFATMLLNYNYPPAQRWFDEGFSQYFSSLYLDDKQMIVGGDPRSGAGNSAFVDVLKGAKWLSIPELFTADEKSASDPRHALFSAQSWIVMHYLLNNDKLPATGNYFGLVENERLPVEEAIQKAYGMASAQLEQNVKQYFESRADKLKAPATPKTNANNAIAMSPAPVTADDVGSSTHEILLPVAQALVAEMSLRMPEHREQARKTLEALTDDPKSDSAIAHRALAWDSLEQKIFDTAIERLGDAAAIDAKDPWVHYYLALTKHRLAQSTGHETPGLANMQQDLHAVLTWDPQFAEAYGLLAMAQREGGGLHAAIDSIRAAIQLSPRNQHYLMELAQIYLAGKNWDAGTALLERLTASQDKEVAAAARQNLEDLPYLKKYGVPPQHEAASQAAAKTAEAAAASPAVAKGNASASAKGAPTRKATPTNEEATKKEEGEEEAPAEPQIDRRPIQYAKGKLVSVDCSSAPAAVLTVAVGAKSLKLRTQDYKALPLIGADQFSCDWSDRLVSVNYKPGKNGEGDLVSLELR